MAKKEQLSITIYLNQRQTDKIVKRLLSDYSHEPTDAEIAIYLDKFFKRSEQAKLHSPIWRTIKTNLEDRGNWKNLPRGRPTPENLIKPEEKD